MTATVSELNPKCRSRSDRERFGDILAVQRAAYLRDGAPSLTKRRSDLKRFKAAMLARRSAIEEAINTDFGHRSRHAGISAAAISQMTVNVPPILVTMFLRVSVSDCSSAPWPRDIGRPGS